MAEEPRTAFQVLSAATMLGLLGILLFNDASWGINMFFWMLALGLGAFTLSKLLNRPIPKVIKLATPCVLLFAACYCVREAVELKVANGFALFLLIGAVLVRTKSGSIAQASLYDLTVRAVAAWFNLTSDFARFIVSDVKWTLNDASKERTRAIVRGLLIATPLLVVFGALFSSADDAFHDILSRSFNLNWLDGESLFRMGLIFCFCSVMATGCYRVMLVEQEANNISEVYGPPQKTLTLGITEIAVVFGMLNSMFALFVIVQAEYLFGGLHHLKSVGSLTYTEYARHGFFELTFVSAGALATILGFHYFLRDPVRNQRSFSILSGILAVLVAVVLSSAFYRMSLYINFAGLTQLRVYTTAFMVWIGAVLAWLAATVLRGKGQKFAAGALASGLAAIFVLNVLNPDGMIARVNLAQADRHPDLSYLESLSVDAAPALLSGAQHLPEKDVHTLKQELHKRWSKEVDTDWRGINFSRWQYLNFYRNAL